SAANASSAALHTVSPMQISSLGRTGRPRDSPTSSVNRGHRRRDAVMYRSAIVGRLTPVAAASDPSRRHRALSSSPSRQPDAATARSAGR
ncbi:MAG: hypothetical protein AVDCRST_MAG36-966, partial [uncultured Nocardioidaceae bacterium]